MTIKCYIPFQPLPDVVGDGDEEHSSTMTRLYATRVKTHVKQLASKCAGLEEKTGANEKKLEETEQELASAKLLVQQVRNDVLKKGACCKMIISVFFNHNKFKTIYIS